MSLLAVGGIRAVIQVTHSHSPNNNRLIVLVEVKEGDTNWNMNEYYLMHCSLLNGRLFFNSGH